MDLSEYIPYKKLRSDRISRHYGYISEELVLIENSIAEFAMQL